MKIGMLGGGHVGGALGKAWSHHGHEIFFGARDPEAAGMGATLAACGHGAQAGSVVGAAGFADVIVIALPWNATELTLASIDLAGKILIDCANPPPGTAGAGTLACKFPRARIAKCFNITGANNMANPNYPGGRGGNVCMRRRCRSEKRSHPVIQGRRLRTFRFGPTFQRRTHGTAREALDLAFLARWPGP